MPCDRATTAIVKRSNQRNEGRDLNQDGFISRQVLGGAAIGVILATIIGALWFDFGTSAAGRVADGMLGERWFVVRLRHAPIGQFHTAARKTSKHYVFETRLEFSLGTAEQTYIADTLVFDASPPHHLVGASHQRRSATTAGTDVSIANGTATITTADAAREVGFPYHYQLDDYLELELWLAEGARQVGERRATRALDFENLTISPTSWEVVPGAAGGISVARQSMVDQTTLDLDASFAPTRLDIAGLFVMERVDDAEAAKGWQVNPFQSLRTHVPLDQPLENHTALRRLVMGVEDVATRELPAWLPITTQDHNALIVSDVEQRAKTDAASLADALAETLRYPTSSPRFKRMAERAVLGLSSQAEQASALTLFVNSFLDYDERRDAGTVHDTVRRRSGDCSEYAELLTTLARSIGLPARTVIGLAYNADRQDFSLHAWNEVAIAGEWHGFDPTWGQTDLDATHLKLPDEDTRLFADFSSLRFRLLEAVH